MSSLCCHCELFNRSIIAIESATSYTLAGARLFDRHAIEDHGRRSPVVRFNPFH